MAFCRLLWVLSLVVLTTAAAALQDSAKREVPAQEMNNIFTDESKRKLSDEVVSFGNQQNKPAGMIDDTLAQDIKRETSNAEQQKDTENHQAKRAPIMSEGEIETTPVSDDSTDSDSKENYISTPENLHESNFPDYSDMEGDFQNLRNNPADIPAYEEALYGLGDGLGWPQYPPMLQDKYRRFRRFAGHASHAGQHQRRGIRSSLEQLLEANKGGRLKRDLRLSDAELVNLLGYLPSSIESEQMMSESQEGYDTPEPDMIPPMDDMRYADPRLALYESLMAQEPYESPYEGQEEEIPEMPFMGPLMKRKLQRRGFYPPMDYRVLGDAMEEEAQWDDLQEEPFHKRRLQSSDEDESEANTEESRNSEEPYDDMGDMLHSGLSLEEVYRRLAL